MRYCFLPMLAGRRASTSASVLSHIRYKANLITCNATSEKWQEYSKILCVFRAPKLFFSCKEYVGSDFKQSSTFQRQNDLVRIMRLIGI